LNVEQYPESLNSKYRSPPFPVFVTALAECENLVFGASYPGLVRSCQY